MNKYLLFDLDGTLSDSGPGVTRSAQYALEKFGIKVDDPDDLKFFLGPPLKTSFMEFYGFSEEDAAKAIEYYRERYRPIGIFENSLFPGVKHMLKTLKRHGCKLAVASSKPEDMVHTVLKTFGVEKCFDVIVGAIESEGLIEKDAVIDKALHLLFQNGEIDYDNTVMIGDRKFDIEGAKKHGLTSVGLVHDVTFLEELKAAGADYIVFSAKELEKLLLRDNEYRFLSSNMTIVSKTRTGLVDVVYDILYPVLIYFCGSAFLRLAGFSMVGMNNSYVRAGVFLIMSIVMFYLFGYRDLVAARYSYRFRNANNMRGADPIYRKNLLGVLTLICLILIAVGYAFGTNILFSLTSFVRSSEGFNKVSQVQNSISLTGGLFLYGVCSPLAEELVFRGIVYNRTKRHFSVIVSIIITSLLFGAYHGNIVQGTYAFFAALILTIIYEKSGSLFWSILTHGIMNVIGFALSSFIKLYAVICNPLACVIFYIILAFSLYGAYYFEKRNRSLD